MSCIGNLLWLVFGGGILLGLSWLLLGLVWCATIVGIPFGLANFKLAVVSFAPLGKRAVPKAVADAARARAANAYLDSRL